jgi:xylulokinase
MVVGLTLSHTRDQVFRALLEGVGFGVRHNLEAFAQIGARVDRVVAVGGGASSDTWLQIISDIAGVEQIVPQVTLGAAYGDAFLAGRAAGLLPAEAIGDWVRPGRVIAPDPARRATYDRLFGLYLQLYTATRDIVHALKA